MHDEAQIAVIKCWNTTWEGTNSWTLWSQDPSRQVATGMMGVGVVVCGGKKKIAGKRNCVKCVTRCTWPHAACGSRLLLEQPWTYWCRHKNVPFTSFYPPLQPCFFFPFNFKSLQSSLSYLVWQLIQFQQLKAEFPVFSWLALTGLFLGVMNVTERSRTRSRFFIN